jgi:hypothetical protein
MPGKVTGEAMIASTGRRFNKHEQQGGVCSLYGLTGSLCQVEVGVVAGVCRQLAPLEDEGARLCNADLRYVQRSP